MNKSSNVPSVPVEWHAYAVNDIDGRVLRIHERLWFDARAQAMIELGCGQEDIRVARAK